MVQPPQQLGGDGSDEEIDETGANFSRVSSSLLAYQQASHTHNELKMVSPGSKLMQSHNRQSVFSQSQNTSQVDEARTQQKVS